MKHLLLGAVLGLLWLVADVPLTPALAVLAAVVQPVTVAFVLGAAARPLLPGMRRCAR
jgi:hypothetical protein